jgi:Tol biopolymer transport system component
MHECIVTFNNESMKKYRRLIFLMLLCSSCIYPLFPQDLFPVRQITFDDSQESFPCWSPKGDMLIFSSIDWSDPAKTGLWSFSPSRDTFIQILHDLAEHPDYSPDGHYIVYDADTGNHIKIIASTGGCPIQFIPDSIMIKKGGTPCWSADGSAIAFRSGYRLIVADIRTGQFKCIFTRPGVLPIPSCWSLDGKSVFATLRDEKTYESTITSISVICRSVSELTQNRGNLYRYCDLSPDGEMLVYNSKESGSYNLWVMPVQGGNAVQLTFTSHADDGPRWSPDGKSIAFVSSRSGNADIWIMDVDLNLLKRILKSANQN